MTELSPERQALLLRVVDAQEKSLDGIELIFSGLRQSSDPEAALVSEEALKHLANNRAIVEAMIEALTATKH